MVCTAFPRLSTALCLGLSTGDGDVSAARISQREDDKQLLLVTGHLLCVKNEGSGAEQNSPERQLKHLTVRGQQEYSATGAKK